MSETEHFADLRESRIGCTGPHYKSAAEEIKEFLAKDEVVEGVIFADWLTYWNEPEPPAIPDDKKEIVLTWEEAEPMMRTWCFDHGFGSDEVYPAFIWTNKRILFVRGYNGSTFLAAIPRNPVDCCPISYGS